MKTLSFYLLLCSILFQIQTVSAQDEPREAVRQLAEKMGKFADSAALEKIYLHTDKPFYTLGDTLWFKSYLFDAGYLRPARKSGLTYVEISNNQNQVVSRIMVATLMGLGAGNFELKPEDFPQGTYTIRAYSNWMRNFDSQYIFQKRFHIESPQSGDWLIQAQTHLEKGSAKPQLAMNLQLTNLSKQPIGSADVEVKLMEGNKVWYKGTVKTAADGSTDFHFPLPEKADPNQLNLSLEQNGQNQFSKIYTIPVLFNTNGQIDLQFMPEGGALVAGITSKVGFKAIGENGLGTQVSGVILNGRGEQITTFQSNALGMGSFNLLAQMGDTYVAKVNSADRNLTTSYPLPQVQTSGLVLQVANGFDKDSLQVTLAASPDLQQSNQIYFLMGQSRGIPSYGAVFKLNGKNYSCKISKSAFPTGVSAVLLLNSKQQVLNKRLFYIDRGDQLHVQLTSNKGSYGKRDSVGFELRVTDKNGAAVSGSFSIAVTDDAQVKPDSSASSLKSSIYLASDIRGTLEQGDYYFPAKLNAKIWTDLDHLLLTQGWVNYDWNQSTEAAKPWVNLAEKSFAVKGKIRNLFNKPIKGAKIILLAKKPSLIRDTLTTGAGQFTFDHLTPHDSTVYLIQSKNKNGKTLNAGIDVEEFKPPVFKPLQSRIIPWYLNISGDKMTEVGTNLTYQAEYDKISKPNTLREVRINAIKRVRDSKNLNDNGGSDFALTEPELEKAGKITLGELLRKNVKGFRLGYGRQPDLYFINGLRVHLIIDGIDIDFSRPEGGADEYREYFNYFLDYYTAEDIRGIEVMNSTRFAVNYVHTFMGPQADPNYQSFIEITTRGGQGPYLKKTSGTYLYKPPVFGTNAQFYIPKYKARGNSRNLDIRSTIYWAPNVVTDKSGFGHFFFYTADKAGSYTLRIDGTDMNGGIESLQQKINVK